MNHITHLATQNSGKIISWILGASLTGLLGFFSGNRWEKKKLSRTERANAYSKFLDTFSKQWKNHSARDRIAGSTKFKNLNTQEQNLLRGKDEWKAVDEKISSTRDELYSAYTLIEILGSTKALYAAHQMVKGMDNHQKGYFSKDVKRLSVGERSTLIETFVNAARRDLGHRGKLKLKKLR